MAIEITRKLEEPPIPAPMPPTKYDVLVSCDDRLPIEDWEWACKADTLDEAAEYALSLGKRYFIAIVNTERRGG